MVPLVFGYWVAIPLVFVGRLAFGGEPAGLLISEQEVTLASGQALA